jgi:tetratricopeptide (TPR) repeat protein
MKQLATIFASLLVLLNCQSKPVKVIKVSPNNKALLDKHFENLQIGHFEAAWNGFRELRKRQLNPAELDLIDAGEARTYFLLGEPEKSLIALRELLTRDLSLNPKLRRQARFYLVDALEEVGNLNEALASLNEIRSLDPTLEEQLIVTVRSVTLLLKLQGNTQEIKTLKTQADQEYQALLTSDSANPELVSKCLFEASWNSKSFFVDAHYGPVLLSTLIWVQSWQAKAIQQPDNKWAQVSLRQIQLQLKELWQMSINPVVNQKLDPKSADQIRRKISIKRLNSLLDTLQTLELEFPIPFPNPERPKEIALSEFITKLKSQVQTEIDELLEKTNIPERKGRVFQDLWEKLEPLPEINL